MIAASLLQREGWENLTVVLGGLAVCSFAQLRSLGYNYGQEPGS
jgi:hypothetical protein